jgi:hypothetical protein
MSDINNVGKGLLLILATGEALMFLKIGRVISWSWIWVTIPFWGPFALLMLIAIMLIILKMFSKLLGWVARIK